MIFIIGKKKRCEVFLSKIKNTKYEYIFIEYVSKNLFILNNLSFSEKQIFKYISKSQNEVKIVFLKNVSSVLNCKWNEFNTFISHGGRLPQYKGASVINWQIINQEKYIVISIVFFNKKLDSGNLIFEKYILSNKPLTLLRPKIDDWYSKKFLDISKTLLNKRKIISKRQKGKTKYWPNRTPIHSLVNINLIKNYNEFKSLVYACEEGYWLNFYINENEKIFVSYCSKNYSSCLASSNIFKGNIIKISTINFSCYAIQNKKITYKK